MVRLAIGHGRMAANTDISYRFIATSGDSTNGRFTTRDKGRMIMMACNYPSKKALKDAIGKPLRYTETSLFGAEYRSDGKFCVVGPSPYERKFFAEVTMAGGLIAKVK